MKLLVLLGMPVAPKQRAAHAIVEALHVAGRTVTVFDNGDVPLPQQDAPIVRLRGGCVCCALVSELLRALRGVTTDAVLLVASAAADPELLAVTLDTLRRPGREIVTIALADSATAERFPHLDAKLRLHADCVLAADAPIAALGDFANALVRVRLP